MILTSPGMASLMFHAIFLLITPTVNGGLRVPIANIYNQRLSMNETIPGGKIYRHLLIDIVNGSIGVATLLNYPNIKSLVIHYSNITEVEDSAICKPELTRLSIENNKHFPNLTEGILSGCQNVLEFTTDVQIKPSSFKHMPKVQVLGLSRQNMSHLTKQYLEPMQELRDLTLRDCVFNKVDPNVLCSSPKIERIQMLGQFSPITRSHFENCSNLKYISILYFGNNHQNIELHSFTYLPKLKELELHNLNIIYVSRILFEGLPNLESLALDRCNIRIIDPGAFEDLRNLTKLSLQWNDLMRIDSATLTNLSKLHTLDLTSNRFQTLGDIPDLPSLHELVLKHNSVETFELYEVKKKFPKLEKLYVEGNPLEIGIIKQVHEIGTTVVVLR